MAVAGIEVGHPNSIDEVDEAWLTKVFRTSGAIDEDTTVATLQKEDFAVGAGLLGSLSRATMSYEGQQMTAGIVGLYARECAFYRDHAESSPFGTATWFEHPDLEAMSELYMNIKNDIYLMALPAIFDAGWPKTQEIEGEALSPEVTEFLNNWGRYVPFFLESLNEPKTLLHGDWRADNLMFSDEGLTVIDFQIVSVGTGAYDLGYFASQSIPVEIREQYDDEIIQLYLDTMAANGINLEKDLFFRQYKIALAMCVVYAVTSFQAYDNFPERSRDLVSVLFRRAVSAIESLNVLELMPALD